MISVTKIEENIREVLSNFTPATFIYDLLIAYGKPKASIAPSKRQLESFQKDGRDHMEKESLL